MTDTPKPERSRVQLLGRSLVPAVILAFGGAFYLAVADMGLQSAAYPRLVIVTLFVISLLAVVREAVGWASSDDPESPDRQFVRELWGRWSRAAYTILLLFGFVLATSLAGFYIAVVPFIAALLLALGIRRKVVVAGVVVASVVISHVLFEIVLGVPLPDGPLG